MMPSLQHQLTTVLVLQVTGCDMLSNLFESLKVLKNAQGLKNEPPPYLHVMWSLHAPGWVSLVSCKLHLLFQTGSWPLLLNIGWQQECNYNGITL